MNQHTSLLQLRKEIANIDRAIILLLAKRLNLAHEVGTIKNREHSPIIDRMQWKFVLENNRKMAYKHGIDPSIISKIWHVIHNAMIQIEKEHV